MSPGTEAVMASAIWGIMVGCQVVAMWEFHDLVLRASPNAVRHALEVILVPLFLALDRHWLDPWIPLSSFAAAWLAMWFLEPEPLPRALGGLATTAAWLLTGPRPLGLPVLALAVGAAVAALAMSWVLPGLGRLRLQVYAGAGLAWGCILALQARAQPVHAWLEVGSSVAQAIVLSSYVLYQDRRRGYWQEQRRRAEHDALTDLLTRHGWSSWRERHSVLHGLVVACDLDDFKWVNDTFGHHAGDQVLQEVARRLRSQARPEDAIVRPGGDEIVVWMPGVESEEAQTVVHRLHRALTTEPYPLPDGPIRIGISIGWACGPLDEATAQQADAYLVAAKRQGKNRVVPDVGETGQRPDGVEEPVRMADLGWLSQAVRTLWAAWEDGAVLTDANGRILTANPAYERLTGRRLDDLMGQKPGHQSAGETPRPVYEQLWQTIASGGNWRGYLKNRRPNGETWWAKESIVPILLGDRVVAYWAHVVEKPKPKAALSTSQAGWEVDSPSYTFDVRFQPIVRIQDGSILGWEALTVPMVGGKEVSPAVFFSATSGTPEEVRRDLAAIRAISRAVRELGGLPEGHQLFVNVRPATVWSEADFLQARAILEEAVPLDRLVWEISEHAVRSLADWASIRRRWPECVWAQDDLGAGEADLVRLVRLRPSWIKIDGLLVRALDTDPASKALVAHLTSWAHRLGIRVIGEGVETQDQATVLGEVGADAGQGFYWARPQPKLLDVVP